MPTSNTLASILRQDIPSHVSINFSFTYSGTWRKYADELCAFAYLCPCSSDFLKAQDAALKFHRLNLAPVYNSEPGASMQTSFVGLRTCAHAAATF